MNSTLLDLLDQSIYTDAKENSDRVTQVRAVVRDIKLHLANETLIEKARELYQTEDVEIDDDGVETSRALEGEGDGENGEPTGTWVQAWVWVPDNDLA